jgi:hypothetical protein
MKRYFVRRTDIGWEIWDREQNAKVYHALSTKRRAQDRVNSLNYWASCPGEDLARTQNKEYTL